MLYINTRVIEETDPTPPIVGYGAVVNVRAGLAVPSEELVDHPSARRYEHLNLSLVSAVAAKVFLTCYLDFKGPKRIQERLYYLGDLLREECDGLEVKVVGP